VGLDVRVEGWEKIFILITVADWIDAQIDRVWMEGGLT